MVFNRKLDNGIRIIGEKLPHFRSVALGVWVGTGSQQEQAGESGASHFIEHMLFKGTKTRTASQLAGEMDSIGGNMNAFTSKECTCFYAKVLGEHLDKAADILSDVVLNSQFPAEEIEKEKGVVCEEILMTEDSPEDLAHEKLGEIYYEDDPLSKPILGSEQSVRAFTRDDLLAYMQKHYTPDNMVISCAGNFDEDELTRLISEKFKLMPTAKGKTTIDNVAKGGNRFSAIEKDVEQVHICIGMPGYAIEKQGQYALFLLNNALGGCMSSRLFQKIREERGLAYSVYSYPTSYVGTGNFVIYAGTGEGQAKQVVELMLEQLEDMRKNGITKEEFDRAKDQLRGNYLLSQESTTGRMNSIGKSELLLERTYTEDERLAQIEGISMEAVESIIPVVFDKNNFCAAIVGRVKNQSESIFEMIQK